GNIIKLDHLDARGAAEAIEKPLQQYNKENGAEGKSDPQLVQTLIEEAKVTKLEMEEVKDDAPAPNKGNGDARYRALALQAVLIRVWEKAVGPADAPVATLPKKFILSFAALSEIARERAPGEPEVNYVVRTYFDKTLESL